MNQSEWIPRIVEALALPASALVDIRVPKKLLVEQMAPTPADRKAIQEGIDELQWLATCKPTTVAVPVYKDDVREYLEIAVIACVFRSGARSRRVIELIHRAIPYPVILISTEEGGAVLSGAHKRFAQNEAGKTVAEDILITSCFAPDAQNVVTETFLKSIQLAQQPKADLFSLYGGWLDTIEALNAARISGSFDVGEDPEARNRRRAALDTHSRLTREISVLRGKAFREKQLSRRVELNLQIQRLEAELKAAAVNL